MLSLKNSAVFLKDREEYREMTDEGDSSGSEFTNDIDHVYTRDDLMALTPNVPLLENLEKADGYPEMDKYYIQDPASFEKLNELYTEENLPLMTNS